MANKASATENLTASFISDLLFSMWDAPVNVEGKVAEGNAGDASKVNLCGLIMIQAVDRGR
jgi:hypothetical protein